MGDTWMTEDQKRRQAEWKRSHGKIVTKIAGVTFKNEDGSSRQRQLKNAFDNAGEGVLQLIPYKHEGEDALRVLYNDVCVGTIPRDRVAEIMDVMDKVTNARLDVESFTPDDEPGAKRSKIYRADLVLVYRKDPPDLPAEPQPEPQPAPLPGPELQSASKFQAGGCRKAKKNNVIPIIGIVLVILSIIGGVSGGKSASSAPSSAPAAVTAAALSKEQLVQKCISSADQAFPGHTDSKWDQEAGILTVQIWIDGANLAAEYAKAGDKDAQAEWDKLLETLTGASGAWQQNFDDAGYDVMVVLRLLNPKDQSLALASVRGGELTYDCVSGLLK